MSQPPRDPQEFLAKERTEGGTPWHWFSVDPAEWLGKRLESTSPNLLREILATFVTQLMSAEGDAACGAGYGSRRRIV